MSYIAAAGMAMGAAGGIIGILNSGSKPKPPPVIPVNAGQQQQIAIQENAAAMPGANALAHGVNAFNEAELRQMAMAHDPQLTEQENLINSANTSRLRGELPADAIAQAQRSVAGQSLAGGFAGAGLQRDFVARDILKSSDQLITEGQAGAQSWLTHVKNTLTPQLMDPTTMFLTPQQQLAHAVEERNAQWNAAWLGKQIDAMPDPQLAAISHMLTSTGGGMFSAGASGGGTNTGTYSSQPTYFMDDTNPNKVWGEGGGLGEMPTGASGPESMIQGGGVGGGVDTEGFAQFANFA